MTDLFTSGMTGALFMDVTRLSEWRKQNEKLSKDIHEWFDNFLIAISSVEGKQHDL